VIDVPGRSPLGFCLRSPLGVKNMTLPEYPSPNFRYDKDLTYYTGGPELDALTLTFRAKYWQPVHTDPYPVENWNTGDWCTRQFEYEWILKRGQVGIKFSNFYVNDFLIVTPTPLIVNEPTSAPDPTFAAISGPKETATYTCLDGGFFLSQNVSTYVTSSLQSRSGDNLRRTYRFYLSSNYDWYDLDNNAMKLRTWLYPDNIALAWAFNNNVRHGNRTITLEDLNSMGFDARPGHLLKLYFTYIPEGQGFVRFILENSM